MINSNVDQLGPSVTSSYECVAGKPKLARYKLPSLPGWIDQNKPIMSGPNGDPNISIDDGIIDDEDEFSVEEYAAINSMLDQINSCLDDLEERNDSLNGKLLELLESNRQVRQEFISQQNASQPPDDQPLPDKDSSPSEGEKSGESE